MHTMLAADDRWRIKTTPKDIPAEFLKALIAKEDRWFYRHPGVNPFSVGRALFSNIFTGRRTSGASTITMQVARLLEPKPRTYFNKACEMFRAFQLEYHYDKEEIMQFYLSYLPYGGNVEGVYAASMIYYQRPPSNLSLSQSILLTVIPNRPNSLRMDRHPKEAKEARDLWIARFEKEGVFSNQDLQIALNEPVQAERISPQPKAPHLSNYISQKLFSEEVQTTIDLEMQSDVERILANHVRRTKGKGVNNGAVLVVDNATREVLAYVGSADFDNVMDRGQVNGVRAIRSPGSALKPAVYALGFDKGIITPGYIYHDVPTDFGGYKPENYDLQFRGPVTVEKSLRNSLNIPAVSCLQDVGTNSFFEVLKAADFSHINRNTSELGLSAILGGCGVTLEQMTNLYCSFASGGSYQPLVYVKGAQSNDKREIFSPSASYLVAEILSGIERPDIPNDLLVATNKFRIAWKTGTSFGRRDAWAIGFNPKYTIGVWMGNMDGTGAPDLSGTSMAVPLLFDVFNSIDDPKKQTWFTQPPTVRERFVCSETGLLPDENCKHKEKDLYIHRVSHQNICDLNRTIYIKGDSSIQYCTGCLPTEGYAKVIYPMFEPSLMSWMDEEGMQYPRPPKHNSDCGVVLHGEGPRINSPSPDYDYLVEAGSGQEILLHSVSAPDVVMHYWYINGEFVLSTKPGERAFFKPPIGQCEVICMDDKGRQSEVTIEVSEY